MTVTAGPSRAAALSISRRADRRRLPCALLGVALLACISPCSTVLAAANLTAPSLADPDWHIPARAGTDTRPPANRQFALLSKALAEYRAIEQAGGWPQIPGGAVLSPGVRDSRVELLRNRLRLSGDFRAEMQADPWFFDTGVNEALRRHQARHGLPATGVLDERTREALNVPAGPRADQLAVTLERWRWLPEDLGTRYAWVNTAAATLHLFENGARVLAMRTIVGHPSRPTPSLASEIRQVIFNPTWSVPYTIAVEDLLPRQQEDPAYLARHRFRVLPGADPAGAEIDPARIDWARLSRGNFPYRLRQDAGPGNSLGRIKLVMDNPFDIYLHDTPERGLFGLTSRTLGSGCIRLEDARALATLLVAAESDWSAEDTARRIDSGGTSAVSLRRPLPIYVVYLTAWVDDDGTVNFRRDLYGRDARMIAAMRAKGPAGAASAATP
jgi:murein L,D-transpeptidase YcbB/YkuD